MSALLQSSFFSEEEENKELNTIRSPGLAHGWSSGDGVLGSTVELTSVPGKQLRPPGKLLGERHLVVIPDLNLHVVQKRCQISTNHGLPSKQARNCGSFAPWQGAASIPYPTWGSWVRKENVEMCPFFSHLKPFQPSWDHFGPFQIVPSTLLNPLAKNGLQFHSHGCTSTQICKVVMQCFKLNVILYRLKKINMVLCS